MTFKKQKTHNLIEFDEDNFRIFTKIKDYEYESVQKNRIFICNKWFKSDVCNICNKHLLNQKICITPDRLKFHFYCCNYALFPKTKIENNSKIIGKKRKFSDLEEEDNHSVKKIKIKHEYKNIVGMKRKYDKKNLKSRKKQCKMNEKSSIPDYNNINFVDNLTKLAVQLYKEEKYEDALNIFIRILNESKILSKFIKQKTILLFNLICTLYNLGRYIEAIEKCQETFGLNNILNISNTKILYKKAICYYGLCDFEEADKIFLSIRNNKDFDYQWFPIFNKVKQKKNMSNYQILDISIYNKINFSLLKKNYMKMCKIWHPDKNLQNQNTILRAKNMFWRINNAFDTIKKEI